MEKGGMSGLENSGKTAVNTQIMKNQIAFGILPDKQGTNHMATAEKPPINAAIMVNALTVFHFESMSGSSSYLTHSFRVTILVLPPTSTWSTTMSSWYQGPKRRSSISVKNAFVSARSLTGNRIDSHQNEKTMLPINAPDTNNAGINIKNSLHNVLPIFFSSPGILIVNEL